MFITFEGIEGCGKTTQVQRLEKYLRDHNIPVLCTLEPGGTGIGTNIRRILLNTENEEISPLAELLLYEADRAQHIDEVIKPALNEGKWVVCDRFFDATIAYQGAAREQDMKLIQYLNDKVTQGIRPDITFLLDCPVQTGLKRALMRNLSAPDEGQDRFEREKEQFHRRVREGYLDLSRQNKKRFKVIDAGRSLAEVEKEITDHIRPFINKGMGHK